MNITVFGSSTPTAGEQAYEEAARLGKLLAQAGHTVLTGGYMGTMEAISRGAAEAGGHVVGITSDEIEAWRPGSANQWVTEERKYDSLRARLYALIDTCDAALALPGGVGTLAEITVMWSQMQTSASPVRPFILIGEAWMETFGTLFKYHPDYIPEEHKALLSFAPDVETAFETLTEALSQ